MIAAEPLGVGFQLGGKAQAQVNNRTYPNVLMCQRKRQHRQLRHAINSATTSTRLTLPPPAGST